MAHNHYRIRPAQLSDAGPLCHLLESLGWLPHLDGSATSRRAITNQLAQDLGDPSHRVLVAEGEAGHLLGYAALHRNPSLLLNTPEAYLSELFVHPEARGLGVGSRLLEEAERQAQQWGCSRMMLINNRERQSYQRGFYAGRGWQERAHMANFVLPLVRPEEND